MGNRKDIREMKRRQTLKKKAETDAMNKDTKREFSEKSRFLNMHYDYTHSSLPLHKKDEYLKLKKKYMPEGF